MNIEKWPGLSPAKPEVVPNLPLSYPNLAAIRQLLVKTQVMSPLSEDLPLLRAFAGVEQGADANGMLDVAKAIASRSGYHVKLFGSPAPDLNETDAGFLGTLKHGRANAQYRETLNAEAVDDLSGPSKWHLLIRTALGGGPRLLVASGEEGFLYDPSAVAEGQQSLPISTRELLNRAALLAEQSASGNFGVLAVRPGVPGPHNYASPGNMAAPSKVT